MEPRLTRDQDNAIILDGLAEFAKATGYAILACVPGVAAGILSVMFTQWIAVGMLALYTPIAMLGLFRWWRVCRSARWNDYWESKQETDAAMATLWLLVIPGSIAAVIAIAALVHGNWTETITMTQSAQHTLTGLLPQ